MPRTRNVYNGDMELDGMIDCYLEENRGSNFSQLACDSMRLYFKIKDAEREALKKSKITLSDITN